MITWIDGPHWLSPWYRKISLRIWIPAFRHNQLYWPKRNSTTCFHLSPTRNSPRFLHDLPQDPDRLIIGHVLEIDIVHLQYHVARLYPTV